MYIYTTSLLSLCPATPAPSPVYHRILAGWLGCLCYTAASHQPSILHMVGEYVNATHTMPEAVLGIRRQEPNMYKEK